MQNLKTKIDNYTQVPEDTSLDCQAFGCPNRWSVDQGSRLCSAHAWADPIDWPSITRRIQSSQMTKQEPYHEPAEPMTIEEKRYVLQRLAEGFKAPKDHKAWAYHLKDREAAGEELSPLKKQLWRTALRHRDDA